MKRLQKSRAKNSEFAQFTSPDQLHTEHVGAQDDYSPSNQRLVISSSFSSPTKNVVEVRRRPLGNLNNPRSREAMFSPDRPSRVHKWTNVINEAYEKNGLDSPLRSTSKKKKKPMKGGRAKNILDSFEISRTRSAQKKSDDEEAPIERSNEIYMIEATATTNNISVSQSPRYFEFDPTAVNYIRRTRIPSQNLFTSEGNSYHFSSSSSSEEETSGDMNETFDTEPRSNTKKSHQMKNLDEPDESDTFHETKSHQQHESISRNFNYSKNIHDSVKAMKSTQRHASNDQSKQIPTQSLNISPMEEHCSVDWSVSNTNVTAEVEECIADIFSQEMAPDDIVQMYKKQISIPTDVLCKRKKRDSKLKKYTEKNVLEKYNKIRNFSQSSCKDMTSSTLEVEECTLDILEQTMIGRGQVDGKYQKNIVSESTLEVEECTADILEQTMATAVSETALEVEECTADVLEQTMTSATHGSNAPNSKHVSDTTIEIEECIADIMEQTMASERFVQKSPTHSSSRQVSFSGDEWQNTTEEISQCVKDLTNPSHTHSVCVSREISECVRDVNSPRNNHIESISSDLSTGPVSMKETITSSDKNHQDQRFRLDKLKKSPTASLSTSTTMSNDAETSHSSNQELHALIEDIEQELTSAETTGSLSIGENKTLENKEMSREEDILQSSLNLSKQERMKFLSETIIECLAKYDFEQAIYISRGIIQIQKSCYGENGIEVASAYCDIGEIHLQYSNFISDALQIKMQCEFSIDAFASASSIVNKSAGENHPWVSMCLARVGLIYLKIQKHKEAIKVFEECLFLRRKYLGTKHPLVAKIQNNLGIAYLSQGSFRKALEAFECAFSIQRREIRKSDPNDESLTKQYTQLCDTLSNIGSLCLDWGEKRDIEEEMRIKLADNAIKAFSESLRIYRGALPGLEQAKEELERLRVEAEKMKRNSYERSPSPDISIKEPSHYQNVAERFQTIQHEESCVIKNDDCISTAWNSVCSLPFDEMSTYIGNKSNNNCSVASRVEMQEVRTSFQQSSTDFSVKFPDVENEFKKNVNIDEVLPTSFGKDSSVRSKSDIAARLQEDMSKWISNYSRSSSNNDVVNSLDANSTSKERSLSISAAPSINRRRFEKDNPTSPFSSPRFPASTIEWNPEDDTVNKSAEVSKSDLDTSHLKEELPGMFRNAKEFNSISQRSELHLKGHDSMYSVNSNRVTDTTDDGLIMPAKNCEHFDQQEIDEATIIKNPHLYEIEIHNLAASYLKNDDVKKSLFLFEILLTYYKSKWGEVHETIGNTLHNMGIVQLRGLEYERALQTFEQAVRVRRGAIGKDHADVAISLVKVGISNLLLKRFDDALIAFKDALSVRRHALGHLHPTTARIYNNIGCVHMEFNELRHARKAFEAALDVQRNALCFEPDNAQLMLATATTLCNLAYLYCHRGAYQKTCLVLQEAIGLQQGVMGPTHSSVLSILDSLADAQGNSGEIITALDTYKNILARLDLVDDRSDCSKRKCRAIAIVHYKMGALYKQQKDYDTCLDFLKKSTLYIRKLNAPKLLQKIEGEIMSLEKLNKKNKFDWI